MLIALDDLSVNLTFRLLRDGMNYNIILQNNVHLHAHSKTIDPQVRSSNKILVKGAIVISAHAINNGDIYDSFLFHFC